jgi:hypothetical protein
MCRQPAKSTISICISSLKSGTCRKVEKADEDVINLIAMLFDCILGDRTLPHSLRTLIGRMQIPVLKAALLDKGLFGRSSHPARRLLNDIATAAMGASDDGQREAVYLRLEHVVQHLLNDFDDDPLIFSDLLDRLNLPACPQPDDTLLFERTLNSVLSQLRQHQPG